MRAVLRRLVRWHGGHRYGVLFYILFATLAASPLLTALRLNTGLLQISLAFSLFAALLGVPGNRRRQLLMLVAAVAMGLWIAPTATYTAEVETGALVACAGLALLAAAIAIRFAVRAPVISAEHIYASLSGYLLVGLFFGALHWAIETTWPGSYGEAGAAPTAFPLPTAIYFSFVTLATLGYGDVVPRTEVARGVAVLEAIGGQLYVAVTIARLVGARQQGPRTTR